MLCYARKCRLLSLPGLHHLTAMAAPVVDCDDVQRLNVLAALLRDERSLRAQVVVVLLSSSPARGLRYKRKVIVRSCINDVAASVAVIGRVEFQFDSHRDSSLCPVSP
ncbi:hypothetical protein HPB50_011084 [Hyalomma asiaticum]|uniref:Uncharacterized protein n=1 Tax=Hyalomma asiaticum TaxID=266040 RepID=A0ACB7RVZ0_HYAAI|nr:hypothetical protein HPB50_011084 [Hyalomma asiaticum]